MGSALRITAFLLIAFFIVISKKATAHDDEARIRKILRSSSDAYRSGQKPAFTITLKGEQYSDDHLFHPDSLWRIDYESIVSASGKDQFNVLETFKYGPDNYAYVRQIYVNGIVYTYQKDSTLSRTYPADNESALFDFYALLPHVLTEKLLTEKGILFGGVSENGDSYIIAFKDPALRSWKLEISRTTHLFKKLSFKYHHDLYGDVSKEYSWTDYETQARPVYPKSVRISNKGYLMFDLKLVMLNPREFKIPTMDNVKIANRPIQKSSISMDSIFILQASQHLYEIRLPQTNNRLMLAEFQEFLVLLEGSYTSENMDLVLQMINERFHKPVRFWSFSHCHGQYIGSVRSLVADGARIITAASQVNYLEKICSAERSIQPDRLQLNPQHLQVQLLEQDKFLIEDSVNRLEVYNVGPNHTFDYHIFYFPRQRIIFSGDLCFMKIAKDEVKLSDRTMKFYESVERLGLMFDRIFVSWPLTGYNTEHIVERNSLERNVSFTRRSNATSVK